MFVGALLAASRHFGVAADRLLPPWCPEAVAGAPPWAAASSTAGHTPARAS